MRCHLSRPTYSYTFSVQDSSTYSCLGTQSTGYSYCVSNLHCVSCLELPWVAILSACCDTVASAEWKLKRAILDSIGNSCNVYYTYNHQHKSSTFFLHKLSRTSRPICYMKQYIWSTPPQITFEALVYPHHLVCDRVMRECDTYYCDISTCPTMALSPHATLATPVPRYGAGH